MVEAGGPYQMPMRPIGLLWWCGGLRDDNLGYLPADASLPTTFDNRHYSACERL